MNIPSSNPQRKPDEMVKRNIVAAGAVILAKDTGRLLFSFRKSTTRARSEEWNLWGGIVKPSKSPDNAVAEWAKRQTGYNGRFSDCVFLSSFHNAPNNFRYYDFLLVVEKEFLPTVEKDWVKDYRWVTIDELPTPLHPLVQELFRKIGDKIRGIIERNTIKKDLQPKTPDANKLGSFLKKFW